MRLIVGYAHQHGTHHFVSRLLPGRPTCNTATLNLGNCRTVIILKFPQLKLRNLFWLALASLGCLGCGLDPFQDLGSQGAPPSVQACYSGFEVVSRDEGRTYDCIFVDRGGCDSGNFSVDIPELGRVEFSEFDQRASDLAKASARASDVDEGKEVQYWEYGNVSARYQENRCVSAFITDNSGGSLKPIVPVFYRGSPIMLPLSIEGVHKLFGKPLKMER